MARLPERERNERDAKILAEWKAGYSQNQLAKNYDVSPATINKICKGIEQNNKELVNSQVAINTELVTRSEYEVNAIHKAVDEQTRRANLVFTATEKILQLSSKMAERNSKQIVVKVKEYSKENGSSESLDKIDVELDSSDLKNLADAVDKASLTLGVNQRHSNQQINVNTQNNNTVQNSELNQEIVTKTLENFEDEY